MKQGVTNILISWQILPSKIVPQLQHRVADIQLTHHFKPNNLAQDLACCHNSLILAFSHNYMHAHMGTHSNIVKVQQDIANTTNSK